MTARGWLLIVVVLALIAALVLSWPRLEGSEPVIAAPIEVHVGAAGTALALELSDEGSGLAQVELRVQHPGGTRSLLTRAYAGNRLWGGGPARETLELQLDPAELGLADGVATLVVSARDWSWRGGLAGNRGERNVTLLVDTRPPRIDVESGLVYVQRGGAGAAIYRLSEAPARDGVQVADAFFPGHPVPGAADPLLRVAIFAVPVEAPAAPEIAVEAEDAAGNRARSGFPARVVERRFSSGDVNLPASFLERVAVPLAREHGLAAGTPVESFRRVNSELRARNEEQIREVVTDSTDEWLWRDGAFRQWPNSQVTSRFAEQRRYLIDGRPVSDSRHYGFDLASTSHAPVTASHAGVVLFAGELGIYGQCVILDHGLGLSSLYGHLSRIDVEVGQRVEQGATLGLSGATGLAGGDHLHFALLVGGHYVNPLEWWDPEWVRTHIEVHLRQATAKAP